MAFGRCILYKEILDLVNPNAEICQWKQTTNTKWKKIKV